MATSDEDWFADQWLRRDLVAIPADVSLEGDMAGVAIVLLA